VKEISKKLFDREPRVYSVHAGLECGFIIGKYPNLDCVSIGPFIEDAHTPEERLFIPSLERFYNLLRQSVETLGKI